MKKWVKALSNGLNFFIFLWIIFIFFHVLVFFLLYIIANLMSSILTMIEVMVIRGKTLFGAEFELLTQIFIISTYIDKMWRNGTHCYYTKMNIVHTIVICSPTCDMSFCYYQLLALFCKIPKISSALGKILKWYLCALKWITFLKEMFTPLLVKKWQLVLLTVLEKKDNEVEEKDLREGSGIWFVEERNEMERADGSIFANQQSHVKFETPKIPVIFVLGKYSYHYSSPLVRKTLGFQYYFIPNFLISIFMLCKLGISDITPLNR